MHVDRAKFLFLTTAIASGCGTRPAPEPVVITASAGPDYDTTVASEAQTADAAPEPVAKEEPVPEAMARVGPIEEGYASPPPPAPAPGPVDPKLAKQCASLRPPGPVCESFQDTVDSCNRYSDVLVPKAADAAVKCLTKRSKTKRICEFGVDAVCATEGSKAAKTDPTAAQTCASMFSQCKAAGYRGKDLTSANCQGALSGYKPEYRTALVSCISEFCEIGSCFYQMR
jgi:hypothetical protein